MRGRERGRSRLGHCQQEPGVGSRRPGDGDRLAEQGRGGGGSLPAPLQSRGPSEVLLSCPTTKERLSQKAPPKGTPELATPRPSGPLSGPGMTGGLTAVWAQPPWMQPAGRPSGLGAAPSLAPQLLPGPGRPGPRPHHGRHLQKVTRLGAPMLGGRGRLVQCLLETSGPGAPQGLQQWPGMADGAGSSPGRSLWGAGAAGERGWPRTWDTGHRAGSRGGTDRTGVLHRQGAAHSGPGLGQLAGRAPGAPAGLGGPALRAASLPRLFLKWSQARQWPGVAASSRRGRPPERPPPPPRSGLSLPLRATLPHPPLVLCLFQSTAEPRVGVGVEDSPGRAGLGGTVPGAHGPRAGVG